MTYRYLQYVNCFFIGFFMCFFCCCFLLFLGGGGGFSIYFILDSVRRIMSYSGAPDILFLHLILYAHVRNLAIESSLALKCK